MKQLLLVFLGGGLGSILRYLIGKSFNTVFHNLYLGTFVANMLGCLLIGIFMALSLKANYLSQNQTVLLIAGFCGGFTTFSTFALENLLYLKEGHYLHFIGYAIGSIAAGLAAVAVGFWLAKYL